MLLLLAACEPAEPAQRADDTALGVATLVAELIDEAAGVLRTLGGPPSYDWDLIAEPYEDEWTGKAYGTLGAGAESLSVNFDATVDEPPASCSGLDPLGLAVEAEGDGPLTVESPPDDGSESTHYTLSATLSGTLGPGAAWSMDLRRHVDHEAQAVGWNFDAVIDGEGVSGSFDESS